MTRRVILYNVIFSDFFSPYVYLAYTHLGLIVNHYVIDSMRLHLHNN